MEPQEVQASGVNQDSPRTATPETPGDGRASELHLSAKTVGSCLSHIRSELGLSGGEELAHRAVHWVRPRDLSVDGSGGEGSRRVMFQARFRKT